MSYQRYLAAHRASHERTRGPIEPPVPPLPVIAKVLIAKGVITEDEYWALAAEELEELIKEVPIPDGGVEHFPKPHPESFPALAPAQ